eukprot:2146445-Karenia_brevis.AAC.1
MKKGTSAFQGTRAIASYHQPSVPSVWAGGLLCEAVHHRGSRSASAPETGPVSTSGPVGQQMPVGESNIYGLMVHSQLPGLSPVKAFE